MRVWDSDTGETCWTSTAPQSASRAAADMVPEPLVPVPPVVAKLSPEAAFHITLSVADVCRPGTAGLVRQLSESALLNNCRAKGKCAVGQAAAVGRRAVATQCYRKCQPGVVGVSLPRMARTLCFGSL